MHFKSGEYLRVTTPKTENGLIPATVNGVVQTKETHLPLSARKALERKNNRLVKNGFKHLAAKIEVVRSEVKAPTIDAAQAELENLKLEMEKLRLEKEDAEKQLAAAQSTFEVKEESIADVSSTLTEDQPEKNKGGRPPKPKN